MENTPYMVILHSFRICNLATTWQQNDVTVIKLNVTSTTPTLNSSKIVKTSKKSLQTFPITEHFIKMNTANHYPWIH